MDSMVEVLRARFEEHPRRHEGIAWGDVAARLADHPEALAALRHMEDTGGEPDVVGYDAEADTFTFYDCSPETPAGRRSLCLDEEALCSRRKNPPRGSAAGEAASIGVELMGETEYRHLQSLGEFDLKTSTWLATPPEVRSLGGALFGDRRFGRVFIYHNGADSYYGARGWRGVLRV
ncbi:DUF4256 domain-containing protein [Actinomyces sp. MRS3W]|uniref:DUF4256 domain-containing protein n=1 Tax=Actinomyces sp. MRS3W TaxID=2800796 RepID=UPI0028FD16C8|nr:DUF4256 domain-containing protein [Actinomyces sp. MRS3W]MDU0348630.1 DUF4256 domain-containing protein [Actinomyces sp. MRS3W]